MKPRQTHCIRSAPTHLADVAEKAKAAEVKAAADKIAADKTAADKHAADKAKTDSDAAAVVFEECDVKNCANWLCDEWCKCSDLDNGAAERDGLYSDNGCADDGTDVCGCE